MRPPPPSSGSPYPAPEGATPEEGRVGAWGPGQCYLWFALPGLGLEQPYPEPTPGLPGASPRPLWRIWPPPCQAQSVTLCDVAQCRTHTAQWTVFLWADTRSLLTSVRAVGPGRELGTHFPPSRVHFRKRFFLPENRGAGVFEGHFSGGFGLQREVLGRREERRSQKMASGRPRCFPREKSSPNKFSVVDGRTSVWF